MLEAAETDDGQPTPFTLQHLRVVRAQLEGAIVDLRAQLGVVLDQAVAEAEQQSLDQLLEVVKEQEKEFTGAGAELEPRIVAHLADRRELLLHRFAADRYTSELLASVQRGLVLGQASGMTLRQMASHIAGTNGIIAGGRSRVNLIVRMETARAYDAAHQTGIETAAELLDADGANKDDPMLQRIDEYFDKRNHPFSRVAHGTTAPVGEPWRVPVAAVRAMAGQLGKGVGGILWPQDGADFVGTQLPAHYNDRARRVPWRRSWGEDVSSSMPTRTVVSSQAAGRVESASPEPPARRRKRKRKPPLQPVFAPDPNRVPRGHWPKPVTSSTSSQERVTNPRENEVAQWFSQLGFDCEMLEHDPSATERQPDLRVNGEYVEVVASSSQNAKGVLRALQRKVNRPQASRIAVHLGDTPYTAEQFQEIFERRRGFGGRVRNGEVDEPDEVFLFRNGEMTRLRY